MFYILNDIWCMTDANRCMNRKLMSAAGSHPVVQSGHSSSCNHFLKNQKLFVILTQQVGMERKMFIFKKDIFNGCAFYYELRHASLVYIFKKTCMWQKVKVTLTATCSMTLLQQINFMQLLNQDLLLDVAYWSCS